MAISLRFLIYANLCVRQHLLIYDNMLPISKKTPAEYDKMYTEQLVFKNWYANKYHIDTGCLVLCPEHRTKLSKILTRTDTPYVIQLLRRLIPTRLR